ncbi:hypothetical protein LTR53_007114 [Teratosphaeriaceae sp. CCFEE 6253]|nr:hypothetical protein LTR53_007114 [Teratosphaeriaceae sp. CCFEE 6253]
MLVRRVACVRTPPCRSYNTRRTLQPVPEVPADVDTFRAAAFQPGTPALLPRRAFRQLPAVRKWFVTSSTGVALDRAYLARFGTTTVPLEISNDDGFARIEHSLSFFLEPCVLGGRAVKQAPQSNVFFSAAAITSPTARVYLAQAPINDLPKSLKDDLPVPELILKAGKGDVYDSSVWLGRAPTYTPLHRDPNPNLFVQLAGTKVIRLFKPDVGRAIFAKVQEAIGGSASATMRGEEMMHGAEREALEAEVWGETSGLDSAGWEAELHGGDGLFIPKGWWHSVKGVGEGMTGSVNWWFR